MDALRSDTLHPFESMHSLSCDNIHHMDELSKEKEEELLYGTGGDEEDALSDDSMHLRLSDDDEIEADDVLTPILDNQENKAKNNEIGMTSRKDEDMQTSAVAAKKIMKNVTTLNETKQEELSSGNVSMEKKIVYDYETDLQKNENKVIAQRPWPNYESQWRFSRSPGARSFRSANHHSYNRCRYSTPRGHFRPQLYEYNVRFHNPFLPFERGRANGMYNAYNRSMYAKRQLKKGFKPSILQKMSSSTESDQASASPSKTNISSKTDVNNTNTNVKGSDGTEVKKNDVLQNAPLINDDKNEDSSDKLSNEKVEESATKNTHKETIDGNDSVNDTLKLQHGSTKTIASNNAEFKDTTVIKVSCLNDNPTDTLVKSVVISHENKQTPTIFDTGNTNNTNFDSSDLCVSNNSENVGAFNLEIKCKSEKQVTVEKIENHNVRNQKDIESDGTINLNFTECETDKVMHNVENREFDINTKSVEENYETKLLEKNCSPLVLNVLKHEVAVNDELTLNDKFTHDKTEEVLVNKEEKVSLQIKEPNEIDEGSIHKPTCIVLNDLTEIKDDNEIRVIESDMPIKSVLSNETCDKNQLKNTSNSESFSKVSKQADEESATSKMGLQQQNKKVITKNVHSVEKENLVIISSNKTAHQSENDLSFSESTLSNVKSQLCSLINVKENNGDTDKRTIEVPVGTQRRRRRTKKMIAAAEETAAEEDKQVRESGRQKRRTAKNAEEIIRKKFLNHDSDLESSDGSEKFVAVNYKMNQDACPLSPPSLKRNNSDSDNVVVNGTIKRVKIRSEAPAPNDRTTTDNNSENVKKLNYIHKFFQRDLNEKLPKLKQEELEELLIQKIVETITMRDEIGRLREQARISERNQEITRAKCQQLAKQIKDFEMVLNRNAADRRANNEKPTPPIKINRSVGLQVNFITDHGIQNLRQLQQSSNIKPLQISISSLTPNISNNETNNTNSPRKGIKVRSPRRSETISGQTSVVSQNSTSSQNMSTITPAALVVAKPVDTQHSVTISNQSNVQHIMPNQQQGQQAIVLNGKFPNQINRQGSAAVNVVKPRANDLIDLTDEEEKNKASNVPVIATSITEQANLAQKSQPCFQRVIQTIPGNVSITSQPPSIRVVQPASQPTPTALVNNMNAPRLAYVMQSGVGPTRQLLIAPNSNQIRPVTSCRASFSTLTYKTGISTIANETVRVLTTPAASSLQLNKHPAPLPDTRNYALDPLWKLPPPAPSLKISKVTNGIILSWNMNLTDKYADIASYQLYAYQEIAGVPPNSSLWKKVGDVRALPLPMACTLTQFSEGNNYYFAVRAVDTHSRKGQYSIPGNISL